MPTNINELKYKAKQTDETISVSTKKLEDAVDEVRQYLSQEHSDLFTQALIDTNANEKIKGLIRQYVVDNKVIIDGVASYEQVSEKLISEVLELGPLKQYLMDPNITEIYVNGPNEIRVQPVDGECYLTDDKFINEEQLEIIAKRILRNVGDTISPNDPIKDAVLPDGSRINIIYGNISLYGTSMDIRKHHEKAFTAEEYLNYGTMSEEEIDFLKLAVEGGLTVFVVGPVDSGKTALLKHILGYIDDNKRIITMEDTPELNLKRVDKNGKAVNHVISWVTNMKLSNPIDLSKLVIATLRNSPKRVIIGEVRDKEAYDLINAVKTGVPGMTSLHADDVDDAIDRLVIMCLANEKARSISEKTLTKMIVKAIDIMVIARKLEDYSRKVVAITEIMGVDDEGNIKTNDIFHFEAEGVEDNKIIGKHKRVGNISPALQRKLLLNAVPRDSIKKYAGD